MRYAALLAAFAALLPSLSSSAAAQVVPSSSPLLIEYLNTPSTLFQSTPDWLCSSYILTLTRSSSTAADSPVRVEAVSFNQTWGAPSSAEELAALPVVHTLVTDFRGTTLVFRPEGLEVDTRVVVRVTDEQGGTAATLPKWVQDPEAAYSVSGQCIDLRRPVEYDYETSCGPVCRIIVWTMYLAFLFLAGFAVLCVAYFVLGGAAYLIRGEWPHEELQKRLDR